MDADGLHGEKTLRAERERISARRLACKIDPSKIATRKEPMRVTDSQVHIWAADSPLRPWPAGAAARAHRLVPLEVEELTKEMDAAGVDRAVIVPPSWEGERNDRALEAAAAHPRRLAVMGRLDLAHPGLTDFSTWRDQPGMMGVRLTFHVDNRVEDAAWFWPLAAAASLPVMIFGPGLTPEFGEVARRYPDVRFVIDHLNVGLATRLAELERVLEPLLPLATLDNVAVKISALPCALDAGEPISDLRPHIQRVVEAFGAKRCMWGSDISRLPCAYADWVDEGLAGFGFLTPEETEQVMGESISSWLGWP
jgi:L-fuconolactonase